MQSQILKENTHQYKSIQKMIKISSNNNCTGGVGFKWIGENKWEAHNKQLIYIKWNEYLQLY